MNRQHTLLRCWLAVFLFTLPHTPSLADKHHDPIVAFGDSLSDPGNTYHLYGVALTPPYETLDALLLPQAPFAIGGYRFSNGPTWIEQFARSLTPHSSAGPAYADWLPGRERGTNYAVGGACARHNGGGYDLTDQVNHYLSQRADHVEAETLYVIELGANDVSDAMSAFTLDATGAASAAIVSSALTAISDNIQSLYAGGARRFLLSNVPDISLTPAIRKLDVIAPGSVMAASIVSAQFNAGIDSLIAQLERQLPGLSLTKLDFHDWLNEIVRNPERYHLTNVTDACIMPNVAPYNCLEPERYFFWDGIHPTTAGHSIFADFSRKVLHSVP
ncbi:MAG: SGNH/GDSL hydrolase family protein [Chromatiales bacterium]|jgi:outer membrane lipase/esterase